MKIVVFGPERRVGALLNERVIDLNRGMARQVREGGLVEVKDRRVHILDRQGLEQVAEFDPLYLYLHRRER